MATTATLPLTVWRNDDVCELVLRVRGVDLTDIALAMQIRMHGDASGPALIDLAKVTNGNAEGLRVAAVAIEGGIPVSDLRVRLNKSSRQALPYMGEAGDPAAFEYALLIGGRTRLVGSITVPAHAYGSDSAPAARPVSWRGAAPALDMPIAGATVTIGADQVVELQIDGADQIGAAILSAQGEADRATVAATDARGWAEADVLPSGRSARSWSREAELQAGSSSVAAGIAAGVVGGLLYRTIAAGLAATAADGFFSVRGENAAIYSRLYQKVNGQAVEQTYLAGGIGMALLSQRADVGRTFSVTDYGARGDGLESSAIANTAAIKLAIRMAALSGAGTIHFPGTGTYVLGGDMEILGLFDGKPFQRGLIRLHPGIRAIIGDGATLKLSGGRTLPGSMFVQSFWDGSPRIRNLLVSGLTFDGNMAAQVQPIYAANTSDEKVWQHQHALSLWSADDVLVSDCVFTGFFGDGVHLSTPVDGMNTPAFSSCRVRVTRCEFYDLFGIGVAAFSARDLEVDHCYFHGNGFWVGAISTETLFRTAEMRNVRVHHNVFDFRDGLWPPEMTPQVASDSAEAQAARRKRRRALVQIKSYTFDGEYPGQTFNGALDGISFDDNTVYEGLVHIFNTSTVSVCRNRFRVTYEDLPNAPLINPGDVIYVGALGTDLKGLRGVRIEGNDIESDLGTYPISVSTIEDVQVRGNVVRGGRGGGLRLAKVSGEITGNRYIDCAAPVSDADFAAANFRASAVVVFASGLKPLYIHHETIVETRTGTARGIRHGIVVNGDSTLIHRVEFCSAQGILGDVVKDNGADVVVAQIGNQRDTDRTYRVTQDLVTTKALRGRTVEGTDSVIGKTFEVRAAAGERAMTSYTIGGKLRGQMSVGADGSITLQAFFDKADGTLDLPRTPIAIDSTGRTFIAPSRAQPLVLGGQLRLWAVNSRLYTKQGADPATDTDGVQLVGRVAVPASATAEGVPGQVAWDGAYFYTCHDFNMWRRTPLATW
ncbi:hypothetical protein [Sphingomonas sp. VNH70]|uniref:hypothetical protein n=1 Tax=Sphingomonas silueang TaxID=3156617 RepID=UPI0032B5F106